MRNLEATERDRHYWRNAYEQLVKQTGRDLNDGLGLDPRKAEAYAHPNETPQEAGSEGLVEGLLEDANFLGQDIPTRPMKDNRLSSVDARHLDRIAKSIREAADRIEASEAREQAMERALTRERNIWNNDPLMQRLDRVRVNIAGLRPGDAEAIAEFQAFGVRMAGELEEARAERDEARAYREQRQAALHRLWARAQAAEAQLALCREVLEPFAALFAQITTDHGDGWSPDEATPMRASLSYPVATHPIQWGAFRRASAVLSKLGEGGVGVSVADIVPTPQERRASGSAAVGKEV